MKLRREFTGPVSSEDATARVEKLLVSMKYKEVACPTHLKFVRGRPKSSLYTIRPRGFHSVIHLWIEGHGPDNSKIIVEQEVPKVFQPPHHLAQVFLEGEMDDIQQGILTNIPSEINRRKENRMAGSAHFVYLIVSGAIAFSVARIFGLHISLITGFVWTACFLTMVYFAYLLPFQLIEFRVRHPKNAKIVADPKEIREPVAPKKAKSKA